MSEAFSRLRPSLTSADVSGRRRCLLKTPRPHQCRLLRRCRRLRFHPCHRHLTMPRSRTDSTKQKLQRQQTSLPCPCRRRGEKRNKQLPLDSSFLPFDVCHLARSDPFYTVEDRIYTEGKNRSTLSLHALSTPSESQMIFFAFSPSNDLQEKTSMEKHFRMGQQWMDM